VAEFNTGMLMGAVHIKPSRFSRGRTTAPGTYNVDIYLNKRKVTRANVRFAKTGMRTGVSPCVTPMLLSQLHLAGQIPDQKVLLLQQPGSCVLLSELFPDASAQFDKSRLSLYFVVPQAFIEKRPLGYVDPSVWDAGVPAFRLHYNVNGFSNFGNGEDRQHAF